MKLTKTNQNASIKWYRISFPIYTVSRCYNWMKYWVLQRIEHIMKATSFKLVQPKVHIIQIVKFMKTVNSTRLLISSQMMWLKRETAITTKTFIIKLSFQFQFRKIQNIWQFDRNENMKCPRISCIVPGYSAIFTIYDLTYPCYSPKLIRKLPGWPFNPLTFFSISD